MLGPLDRSTLGKLFVSCGTILRELVPIEEVAIVVAAIR
jgi:hypothetical protein